MLNPFGSSPIAAMFQATWVTTTFVAKAQYNCGIIRSQVGVLILTLQVPVPNITPAPAANSGLSAVNDNVYLVTTDSSSLVDGSLAAAKLSTSITYGPQNASWGATTPGSNAALLGNQIGLEWITSSNTATDPSNGGVLIRGVVYNCYDGGPVTQGAETP
jgi:hypothetical protein